MVHSDANVPKIVWEGVESSGVVVLGQSVGWRRRIGVGGKYNKKREEEARGG